MVSVHAKTQTAGIRSTTDRRLAAKPLATIFVLASASFVFATSGWDRHAVDIDNDFRLYGANLSSFIARLDGSGNPISPPVFTLNDRRVHGPPQYFVTDTHIVLRYESHVPSPKRLYFTFRKRDSVTQGPLTEATFSNGEFGMRKELDWIAPDTAADSFGRMVIAALVLIACAGVGVIYSLIRWMTRTEDT